MLAVIMAGGEGTRLKPFTTSIPKPLLPVGDTPILEIVINQLKNEGFDRVIIATGYKGDIIKAYFQDGTKFGIDISYTTEEKKLGTAGALSLINGRINEPFLVINGDILTQLSLSSFMKYHNDNDACLTLGLVKYKMDIPYGIVETNGQIFEDIQEKPSYFFNIGAGIYGVSPEALDFLPYNKLMDFTKFVNILKRSNKNVICYKIEEYWKDIGILEDFEEVNKEVGGWSQDKLFHILKNEQFVSINADEDY